MALKMDISVLAGALLESYNGSINGQWYENVTTSKKVDTQVGVFVGMEAAPGLAAFNGTRMEAATDPFKITLTNAEFESSIKIPAQDLLADVFDLYGNTAKEMGRKAALHPQNLIVAALAAGHSTDCYDGQKFFDTDHPFGASSTQKNLVTYSDVPALDVVDKANPTATEAANIISSGIAYLQSLKDSAGDPANGDMRTVYVVIGDWAKYAAFVSACSLTNLVNGATNPLAGILGQGFKVVPILETALTGDSIYVLRADGGIKPLLFQEHSSGLDIQAEGIGSAYYKANLNGLFGCYVPRAVGYGRVQSALKMTLHTHS